ncbi:hypothetical protein LINGRAPRIM_LOCUS2396 [Linum grandiflorum]
MRTIHPLLKAILLFSMRLETTRTPPNPTRHNNINIIIITILLLSTKINLIILLTLLARYV